MVNYLRKFALGFLLVCWQLPTHATVLEQGASGFSVTHQIDLPVSAEELSRIVVDEVDRWWLDDHTWSGSAKNLSINTAMPGCFCETLPGGGFVQHMQVIYFQPGKQLRMLGGLGPLQELPVTGVMTFRFEPQGEGSRLILSYRVSGSVEGGLEKWAGPVDSVLGQQLESLSNYIRRRLDE